MSIINFLFGTKPKSSSVAKDRLQIIIAQERVQTKIPDYLPTLKRELLELVSKYVVNISTQNIKIKHEKKAGVSKLELNITLPEETNPQLINKNLKAKTVKKPKRT